MNRLEQEIINKIGPNSTGSGKTAKKNIEFEEVQLSDGSRACECYTFKGELVISNYSEGYDEQFSYYNEGDQQILYNSIMKTLNNIL